MEQFGFLLLVVVLFIALVSLGSVASSCSTAAEWPCPTQSRIGRDLYESNGPRI